MHVHPTFFEPINKDSAKEELRHDALNIHLNGTAPLDHTFNQMKCAGLDKLCLLPHDYSFTMGEPLVSNEEVSALCSMHPDKFIGFASVDPRNPNACEMLERAFSDLKLSGLKLHPPRQKFYPSDPELSPIYDICEVYDKPVVFHSGLSWEPDTLSRFSQPLMFEELAASRPGLRFCLAHLGWPWVREAAMLMLKYPNVYADTGLLYFDSAHEFYERIFHHELSLTWVDRSLRHQIMFGSNNPRFEQIRMAAAISEMGFRDSTVELIKGKNAIEFLHA